MKKIIILVVIFNLWMWPQSVASGDPRFSDQIPIPEHCGHDVNFCHTYCLSIDPGTVSARCAQDHVSCICVNGHGQSIGVRFVQDREPLPQEKMMTSTESPLPPPPQQQQQQEETPQFDYAPSGPVPTLLECDGFHDSDAICNDFCTLEISAFRGACDRADKTCRCEGVDPAVVQPAPIPAMFVPRSTTPATPTTTLPPQQPIQMQNSFWTPLGQDYQSPQNVIQPQQPMLQAQIPLQQGYPDYLYSQWYPYQFQHNQQMQPLLLTQPQQQPSFEANQNQQPGFQMYHYPAEGNYQTFHYPAEGNYQTFHYPPSEESSSSGGGQSMTPAPQVAQMEGTTDMLREGHSDFSTTTQPPPTILSEVHEDEGVLVRRKRSLPPASLRRPVLNYPPYAGETCSESACALACVENDFNAEKSCIPKCFHNTCMCVCRPTVGWAKVMGSNVDELVRLILTSPAAVGHSPTVVVSPAAANAEEGDEGINDVHTMSKLKNYPAWAATRGGVDAGTENSAFVNNFTPPPVLF